MDEVNEIKLTSHYSCSKIQEGESMAYFRQKKWFENKKLTMKDRRGIWTNMLEAMEPPKHVEGGLATDVIRIVVCQLWGYSDGKEPSQCSLHKSFDTIGSFIEEHKKETDLYAKMEAYIQYLYEFSTPVGDPYKVRVGPQTYWAVVGRVEVIPGGIWRQFAAAPLLLDDELP